MLKKFFGGGRVWGVGRWQIRLDFILMRKTVNMTRELYPAIAPYYTGYLKVSALHTIYYEEVGNPQGKPVVFLHGGPGGGIEGIYRQYFDPQKWRIVLFDQRGCGKSTPHAEFNRC